jgi:uncharacterized phiE125 gp8 family phage protein
MIKLITPPTVEPVTATEAKLQCRIGTTEYDTLITTLIQAAREACEDYTRMSFLAQTWDVVLDQASGCIDLPRPPLATVTGVYVTDDAGTETTVSSALYRVDTVSTPGRLFLKPGCSWPYYTEQAGFRVRYTTGYPAGVGTGHEADNVPRAIKQAILTLVAYMFKNNGEARTPDGLPSDVKVLLDPFKVYL